MRLRTLLALMFSLLLAFTAALIGWRGYTNSRWEIRHFTQQEFAETNGIATKDVLHFLNDQADKLLSEYTLRASRGLLGLGDLRGLGLNLAERLRVNPTLAWISYSDAATGQFVGVWHTPSNRIALNLNAPGPGHFHEVIVQPDGTTTPSSRTPPADYDPRAQDWYKNAAASNTTAWSPPYDFFDNNTRGITASRAWRAGKDSPVSGVFTVDFYLTDLQGLLDDIATPWDSLFCAILQPDGSILSTSQNPEAPDLSRALTDWVKSNPSFKDSIRDATHLVTIRVNATDYMAALDRVNGSSGIKCIVASMRPRAMVYHGLDKAGRQMIEIASGALVIAVVLGSFMAWRICAPLHNLERDLTRVGQFQLAEGGRARSVVYEVNQLNDAASRMKTGLRSFLKFVPGDLVRQVLASGREAVLGGEMRRLTIFFSDIESFTSYTETTTPDRLVHELADYFEIISSRLRQNGGEIDKFIGDGVLAFFNAPGEVPQHEQQACRTALAVQEGLATWQREQKGPPFRTRVGLHTGDVLVGNMGTADRLAYTVLGDVVNAASRLEALNKVYGTQVIASGEVHDHAGAEFEWRHLDRAAPAGRKGAMEIYELLGTKGGVDAERLRRRDIYERALDEYFSRAFAEAQRLFAALAAEDPADKASAIMAARCRELAAERLPSDWDGVFAHNTK
jgi:adenylate cyclase